MGRAPCCDKANVKRGPWSSEEDTKLRSHINKHGIGGNWIALPHKIGLKRCGKSCRLRWLNYLRPNIKHGGFTEDEDNLICTLYITIGSRWSIMAAQLPGRTDNDIKNYWNTRLKKKLLGQQQSCKNSRTTDHNYSLNNDISFSHHPQLVPPLPVENWSLDRLTNIIPITPQIEALNFSYDLTQPDHFNSDVSCVQLYEQQICKDQGLENDIQISPPPLDGMYGSLPQPLDGVNGSSNSSSSLDNISWGDANCIVYPQSAMTNYEVCHQEIPQYCTFFDEPRLLGFS